VLISWLDFPFLWVFIWLIAFRMWWSITWLCPEAASDSYSHHQSKYFSISILLQLTYLALSSPILYNFYDYDRDESKYFVLLNEFLQVCLNMTFWCCLAPLFSCSSILHLCWETTFIFGLVMFLQSVALFGALLFFIGMKNLVPNRQLKKKTPKAKVG